MEEPLSSRFVIRINVRALSFIKNKRTSGKWILYVLLLSISENKILYFQAHNTPTFYATIKCAYIKVSHNAIRANIPSLADIKDSFEHELWP